MNELAIDAFSSLQGYQQSSLRFGLIDLKPIEISESYTLGNVRFRARERKLEHSKPISSYGDLVTFENNAIFNSFSIPKRFNAQELIDYFSKNSIDRFERDTELKQEVENLKRRDRQRPYTSFVQFMKERFESRRENYLEIEAERFLSSNFPLSFFNKFTVFNNTYYDFLKITHDIVRSHEFLAAHARSFQMYRKNISVMQRELSPLIDKLDKCSFACGRLKKYVTVWNVESLEEMSEPALFDFKKVDVAEFGQLNDDFKLKLKELRVVLLEQDEGILRKSIDLEDSTAKLFSRLLVMPSSSLNTR